MPTIDNQAEILNITEDVIPDQRISSATAARALLLSIQVDDTLASVRRATIQGMIDGNPPYTDQQLMEANQEDAINVNWGHAEEKVETASLPYFDMLTSVNAYATITTNYGRRADLRDRYSRIITEGFHKILKADKSFLVNHQLVQSNIVIHGPGCLVYRDSTNYKAKSIPPWNILPPKKASVDWLNWEFCFILDDLYTEELYRITKKPAVAESHGWLPENCKDAIIQADNVPKDKFRPWEEHQRELKDNGLLHSNTKSKTIKIAHLFIKEYTGKYSHYIFDRINAIDWLCVNQNCYNSLSEAFCLFLSGTGNGDYHGVRGLGQKVHKYGEAMNRINNSLLEGVLVASSVIFQAETTADVEKIQTVTIGPYRVLPPGLRAAPIANLNTNLAGAMQVAGYFQNQESTQIASHMPSMAGQMRGQRMNEAEAASLEGDKASLTNIRAEIYMQCLDTYYTEVFRRLSNLNILLEDQGGPEALKFQKFCKDNGVPLAALKDVEVQATRSIGQGSPAARKSAMSGIMQLVPMLPEQQRLAAIRDTVAAIGGQQFVDKYAPKTDNQLQGNDATISSLENNVFMTGGQTIIDPNQNHFIHSSVHLQFFGKLIQGLQQQQVDPHQVSQALQSGGPHLRGHLKFLSQDPSRKTQYDSLNQQAAELMKMADQVEQMVQQMDEQQAKQQQEQQPPVDPKMLVAQNQIQLNTALAQSEIERKGAKAQHDMKIKDLKTAQELQIAKLKATNTPTLISK